MKQTNKFQFAEQPFIADNAKIKAQGFCSLSLLLCREMYAHIIMIMQVFLLNQTILIK